MIRSQVICSWCEVAFDADPDDLDFQWEHDREDFAFCSPQHLAAAVEQLALPPTQGLA